MKSLHPMKLLPLALALAVTPMLAHGEDLLDAYRQARANDPVLAQSEATRLATGENVPMARAGLLPQLNASLSLDQTNGGGGTYRDPNGDLQQAPSSGHVRTRSASVTLSQTILDFSKYANLAAAHSQVDSQNALYQAALQNLIVRVTTAYFNVLTAEDQVAFAQSYETQLARQLDQAQQRFKVGLSAITDVQDAKAQHDSARASLITAKNQLNDAREALSEITGQPSNNLEVLAEELPMAPPQPNNLGTWVQRAQQENPNLLAQQFNVETAEHSISAARSGHLPTIDANVSYSKGASWASTGPSQESPGSTRIGLTLNVPLFSGGYTHALVRQSIYQRDAARGALEQQRRQVVRDTRNHFRSVLAGISEVEATRAAVESSRSALAATKAGFEVGTRNIVDVLQAQAQLTNANQNYSTARHQFVLNKLLLEQSAGTLDVEDLEAVNALLLPADQSSPSPTLPDSATPPAPTPAPAPTSQSTS